jgi:putative endonuclease
MYVYILKCSDGSYYTGSSADFKARIADHNRGIGSSYVRSRRPVQLIYFEKAEDKNKAQLREVEMKKLSRENKERLIKYGSGRRVF